MFEQLFNSPFLYSLSLTLVHFLWQGLLVGLILKTLLLIVDQNKSQLRYTLATLAMLANAGLAVITYVVIYPDTGANIHSNSPPIPLTSLVNELTQQNALFTYQELLPSILAHVLPYLSLFWLATITILASKLLIEIRNVNNLPRHSSISPSSALLTRFDELAKQIKLTKTPKLLISLKAEVPMAIGWLKPVVLLPATMATGLNSAQLEMLILHELAHIRRHDYLVNFLQTLIELLFFFHPCVHWIGKQMRNEREYCSDDIAVQHCGDAIAYAHTLTDTASLCSKRHFHTIPVMAMAASGGDLKARVLRLVDHHCAPTNNTSKFLAAMTLFLTLALFSINQLLTMPATQQLTSQFPWQESLSISNYTNSNRAITRPQQRASGNKEALTLTNDSIAHQLLKSTEPLSYDSLAQENNLQIEVSPITEQESLLIPTTPQSTINQDIIDMQLAQARSKAAIAHVRYKAEQASFTPSSSTISKKIVLVAPTIIEPITANNVVSSTTKVQELVVLAPQSSEKPVVKQVNIAADKLQVDTIAFNALPEDNNELSIAYDKGLSIKADPYRQLNYDDEINALSTQNDLYQASHAFQNIKTKQLIASNIIPVKTERLPKTISSQAKLLNDVSPVYPSTAKRRGIEMEVEVGFTIDKNGKVKDINFVQKSKLIYFKSAIRTAIRKWKFSPATINNLKVESKMSKIFSFSLQA